MAEAGVRPGDRVGVLMANYPEFVPVKFAIAAAGAVAVPFNYLYRAASSPTCWPSPASRCWSP